MANGNNILSKTKINKAGDVLIGKNNKLSKGDANDVLREFRAIHQHPMSLFRHTIDRKLKKHKIEAFVSQRLKRVASVIKKLKIHKSMGLSRMQDIGGLRVVVNTIEEVNLITNEIRKTENHKNFTFKFSNAKDYISNPQKGGYRGIHLIYQYNNQCRVEIQIRTKIQHSWSTTVEVFGTILNQPLKQGFGDEKYLNIFRDISQLFLHLENKSITNINYNLVDKVKKELEETHLQEKLIGFKIAETNVLNKKSYLLLKMNFNKKTLETKQYAKKDFDKANKEYSKQELEHFDNKAIEVVLISLKDVDKLKQSYPNYFMDTSEFIKNLKNLLQAYAIIRKIMLKIDDTKDASIKAELVNILNSIFANTIAGTKTGKKQ